jgi:hypothetical protein
MDFSTQFNRQNLRNPLVVEQFVKNVLSPVQKSINNIKDVCIIYAIPSSTAGKFRSPAVDQLAWKAQSISFTSAVVIADVQPGVIPAFPFGEVSLEDVSSLSG